MTTRSVVRAFMFLWWTVGAVLLWASVRTLQEGLAAKPPSPVALLALLEATSALLFLLPKTMRLGAIGLVLTLGVAFVVHLVVGHARWDLLVYAAAVSFVAVHGPLPETPSRVAALHG